MMLPDFLAREYPMYFIKDLNKWLRVKVYRIYFCIRFLKQTWVIG